MSDTAITYTIVAVAVVLFVTDRIPVDLVAVGVALALWATGVLDLEQSLAGFGDPTVLFIASLFVVSGALDASGITTWAGQQLIARAGHSGARLLVASMVLVALLTVLITPNGSVAALVPVLVIAAVRSGTPPSRLLMPLAFAAHAGALLALTGSPVSVIVSQAAADSGVGAFGFFEFALVGAPLLLGTIAIVLGVGRRLLPERSPSTIPPDLSRHAHTLREQYGLHDVPEIDITRESGLAEVVIAPRSSLVGTTAFPGMVTERGDLVIVAIQRGGEEPALGPSELEVGDVLLVRGSWSALEERLDDPDVLIVDPPDQVRRQAVPLGPGSSRTAAVLGTMVIALASGLVPPAAAGLLAASALVILRVLSVRQAYRSISWTTVVLVAGMIPLSTAMQETGAAQQLAEALVDLVGDSSPYLLLLGVFVVSAALGQLISNTATALIMIPIAVSAAAQTGVSARPVLMSLNVVLAAALLTPVATPANLMVMEPGGYRFGDYWRLGLPLLGLYLVVSVFLVPVIWPF